MYLLNLLTITLVLSSCVSFKTKTQLANERANKGLPVQVEQSQKLVAQMTLRMNELENRIQDYSGEVEEIEYRQQKLIPQAQKEIQDKLVNQSREIQALRTIIQKNQKETDQLKSVVQSQKKYIQKVSKALKTISQQSLNNQKTAAASAKKASKSKAKRKKRSSDFEQGLRNYSRNRYTSAKGDLLSALKNERLNAAQKNQVYQALGHIEFSKKNYDTSNVYFSKIFSKYPKSSMAPDALLHMARAFKGQKNIPAAKEAYKTFISSYPKDKLISRVKKELNTL